MNLQDSLQEVFKQVYLLRNELKVTTTTTKKREM
jgi:hypothetical protein